MENNKLNFKITKWNLFKFAIPTILANVFMSIYTTVDGIFVSNFVGTDALSAVNIVMPFVMIVLALGTMIGTGGSAIVSKQLGESKEKEAKQNFTLLCLVCFIACTVVSILSLIFKEPLLRLLGASDNILDYCKDYATPLFIIAPFALLGIALQSFYISAGKPTLGMVITLIGGIANIFLDYLFIVVFKWELTGAALATGIGYTVPGIVGIFYFLFARSGTLYYVKPILRKEIIGKTITNGSSEMVAMLASGITSIIINNITMNLHGEDGVASMSVLIYIMTLLTSVYIGYGLGVAPVTSYNNGNKNYENLKSIKKYSLQIILISSIVMTLLGVISKDYLILIFSDKGTNVYNLARSSYWLYSISFLYMGFNMYTSSLFTALGDGKTSAIISFIRGLLLLPIALYGLSALFDFNGLLIATPIAEILGLLISFYFINKYKGKYHYA